jgi:hypothetical protein
MHVTFLIKKFKIPWTSYCLELDVQYAQRQCSRCKEFKSLADFYKQGERHESFCKTCKRGARAGRRQPSVEIHSSDSPSLLLPAGGSSPGTEAQGRLTYKDFGFSESDFMEIVELFEELLKLKQKG